MIFTLPNFTVNKISYTDEQLSPILDEVYKIKKSFNDDVHTKFNNQLAGHIKKEYRLDNLIDYVEGLMTSDIKDVDNNNLFRQRKLPENASLVLNELWVNFQQKHEFNPPHRHSGVYSFVIWLDIPYLIEDEWNTFPDLPHRQNSAGCFNFHYTTILGNIASEKIPADITYQNTGVIFPSELVHSVSPFYTSDDYRISISGNWHFHD